MTQRRQRRAGMAEEHARIARRSKDGRDRPDGSATSQLEDRSPGSRGAAGARAASRATTIAICMENNREDLEVAWAAQRSGLRYTAVNSHLRPAEVQYVSTTAGAVALVSSQAMADVVASLELSCIAGRWSARRQAARLRAVRRTCSPPPTGPLADEREGREMLYSSGTTGAPKGVRKQLPGTPFGDPQSRAGDHRQRHRAATPGAGKASSTCARPRCTTPPRWSGRCRCSGTGRAIVVMEQFDPVRVPGADRAVAGDAARSSCRPCSPAC